MHNVDGGLQLEAPHLRMRSRAMSVIEVEKHFTVGPETRSKLTALGAKIDAERRIHRYLL